MYVLLLRFGLGWFARLPEGSQGGRNACWARARNGIDTYINRTRKVFLGRKDPDRSFGESRAETSEISENGLELAFRFLLSFKSSVPPPEGQQ